MLKTRVITAIVLLAVFLPVTLFAPLAAFGVLIRVVVAFAAWEWARLLNAGKVGSIVYAAVVSAVIVFGSRVEAPRALFQAAAVFWIVAGPYVLLRKPALAAGSWRLFLLLAGFILFAACWHALVLARAIGVAFVLSLLLVVWLADIGAYFAGKALGRHKLAPSISPGKTWEGAVGGWVFVMVISLAATLLHAFEPTLFSTLFASVGLVRELLALTVLVAFSVVGDLFESMLKRQAGVKDSSGLLPGHGGVLDRIDALLPVLPLAMLLLA